MTEDEAKTKWCPQSRVSSVGSTGRAGINRDDYGGKNKTPDGTNCIASGCMAWRETSSQHGYCGLAGKPRV